MELAPIVLFVYNRPKHTRQTIESLAKNILAYDSRLIIYSDGPKKHEDIQPIETIRKYLKSIDNFKDVTIIEKEKNWGLADSIINGVTDTINQYQKVIVLEDDIMTTPYFLTFMNNALNFFNNEKKVMHISGWNYPINNHSELVDVFLWRLMNCWGWATWADRWCYFKKDYAYFSQKFTKHDIKLFNIDGASDFWRTMNLNGKGKLNTWAIYWYASIFMHKGLCLNPIVSFVNNIGFDGSGTNCNNTDAFYIEKTNNKQDIDFNIPIYENTMVVDLIKQFFYNTRLTIPVRITRKIKRLYESMRW